MVLDCVFGSTLELPRIVIWPNTEYRIFGNAVGRSAEYSAAEYSAKYDSFPRRKKRNLNENDKTFEIHDSFWNCFEEVAKDNMRNSNRQMRTIFI